MQSIPWIEKYRPKNINEISQNHKLIDLFNNCITDKNIPHFLFYGSPGTGKTSAILTIGRAIFKEQYPNRIIEFNASDDRGINSVREKITHEAKKYVATMTSKDGSEIPSYKIIILDEADSMTDEAQDALRVIIEQYSTVTRFCFICNYISKITDAIKSRCSLIYFKKLDNGCMLKKLSDISVMENIELKEDIINTIIDLANGDMRKAIMILQNVKYLYDFKNFLKKSVNKMSLPELKIFNHVNLGCYKDRVTVQDIYKIASYLDIDQINNIINNTINCKNIYELSGVAKDIIALGYPIDNILFQLNNNILHSEKFTDEHKASIIYNSGNIFLKIRECANEYIQLLSYLTYIYKICNLIK